MNYLKKCKHCGEEFKPYTTLQKYCSARCMKKNDGIKKIKKVSDKRQRENKIYSQLRKVFLSKPENQICPITKQPTTDIHHKKGRIGDLLTDTRFWVAMSREGHKYVEENPEWAKENGYSLNRN